jgi:hypothetical protein
MLVVASEMIAFHDHIPWSFNGNAKAGDLLLTRQDSG